MIVVYKEVLKILQKLDNENCHIEAMKSLREIGFTFLEAKYICMEKYYEGSGYTDDPR